MPFPSPDYPYPMEQMPTHTSEVALDVTGMDCASCMSHVTKAALAVPGVSKAQVNLARGRAVVQFDAGQTNPEAIAAAVTEAGYPTQAPQAEVDASQAEQLRLDRQLAHEQGWFKRAMLGAALWLPVEVLHWSLVLAGQHHLRWMDGLAFVTSSLAMVLVGGAFYRNAFAALKRKTTDMDVLIAIGASVAYGYSVLGLGGALAGWWARPEHVYFMEAAGLLALISFGHYLEARARQSAGRAIHELMQLVPATALLLDDGAADDLRHQAIPLAQVKVGDALLVRPGDRIPTDGVVLRGKSSVDEAMMTGESVPVLRQAGDVLIGGTVNQDGQLIMQATGVGAQTALAQIVAMVETAQNSKPPVQQLADRISAVFVPAVLAVALLTGIGWLVAGQMNHWEAAVTWGKLANAVCSVLIIACPCALGLAVPAALMVSTGMGAKRGILLRDMDALQQAERISVVVFDKTGTLTAGKPEVVAQVPAQGQREEELLRLAASVGQGNSHPLAQALVNAAKTRGLALNPASDALNIPGEGMSATVAGEKVQVGSPAWMAQLGHAIPAELQSAASAAGTDHTWIWLAQAGRGILGSIALADPIKPEAAAAVANLRRMGIRSVLLTGDHPGAAARIAKQAGIDIFEAQVKPAGKKQWIEAAQAKGETVAMVGDGINDAPALAQADLGIAIGSGADVAKETGAVVLVGHSPLLVPAAIHLSRSTMRCIRQNLFLAFIYNILAIPLAAFGLLNPLVAAACMALSDVTVIGNALRLRWVGRGD